MISIPLPFVVSLMLSILAAVIYCRREKDEWPAVVFLLLCTLTTTLVGLRWTTDITLFKSLLPISASVIPATTWYCFARAHGITRFRSLHLIPPLLMVLFSLTYPFWQPPIDPILTMLYLGYGVALIRLSLQKDKFPTQVRLSDVHRALTAERLAGSMLLMSAAIDGAMAVDFSLYQGQHALIILAIGHALILPILALLVVVVSSSIKGKTDDETDTKSKQAQADATQQHLEQQHLDKQDQKTSTKHPLTLEQAEHICQSVDRLMIEKQIYLDPDLTLDRIARKTLIPARQISIAVNQAYQQNISQVINRYRINHAKRLLSETEDTITQIYLSSGFQTKSTFNREFSRIVGQTPSGYRKDNNLRKQQLTEYL